jgi:hypothetical protein
LCLKDSVNLSVEENEGKDCRKDEESFSEVKGNLVALFALVAHYKHNARYYGHDQEQGR